MAEPVKRLSGISKTYKQRSNLKEDSDKGLLVALRSQWIVLLDIFDPYQISDIDRDDLNVTRQRIEDLTAELMLRVHNEKLRYKERQKKRRKKRNG